MIRYTDTGACWCFEIERIGQSGAASRRLVERLIILGSPSGRLFSGCHLDWNIADRVHGSRHFGRS